MTPDDLNRALGTLAEQTPPRVWSLIVTLFGDLAQSNDGAIAGPVLAKILAPIGVRPEAMRVALHRLRGEGWINTEKQGRLALYRLSDMGLQETRNASAQIYDAPPAALPDWHIACCPPLGAPDEQMRAKKLSQQGLIPLGAGTYLGNNRVTIAPKDALVITGPLANVPAWVAASLVPPARTKACRDLTAAIEKMQCDVPDFTGANDLQRATLRTVIVHRWRRIALRLPPACDALLGQTWAGADCRKQVHDVLSQLPRPHHSNFSAKP